ncbi:MAG: nucleotide exchange factor GrpE [Candidatus Paceibacterota bacterium]|jgi:molecular chaperone GrpE|nr:nucleotide exchange factor GrpE [Candidatus Paceibacterota bacterium]
MNDDEKKNNLNGDEESDDVVFEPEEDGDDDAPLAKIKKLREELKNARKERDEYLTGWQRAKADFINARKEEERSRMEFVKSANKELVLDILTTLDGFDMAFANKEAWEKVDANWRKGVEYLYSQLLGTLEQNGLQQLNPVGATFDPNIHTSVESIPVEKPEDEHKILEVVQKGYTLNGSLIRSPKVKVGVKN